MKGKIILVVALIVVGVGATAYSMGLLTPSTAASTQFLTSVASTGDVTDNVAATGTLAPQARYGLVFGSDPYLATDDAAAPSTTTWRVTDVGVAIGEIVKQGDTLATADSADLQRDLASAKNDLLSAKVGLKSANVGLDDARDAGEASQVRQAKISLYNARNQLAQATQNVADIEASIAAATLSSPIDGRVTEVNIASGLDAPSGAAIVVDAAGFEISADVVESDLADIKVGQQAAITVSAVDADLTGTVVAVSPVAGDASGSGVVSYAVTVSIDVAPAALRSGMSADVTITVASATGVLTVPAEALNGTAGNYSVQVLGPDGTPTAQAVEVGLVTSTLAEIKSGLTAGQEVITGVATAQTGTPTTGGPGGGVVIPGGGGFGSGGGRGNFPGGGQGNGGQP
jgi:macrolide-specific efflux system membrane fusion protein